ncbi:mitoferrin-1 [Coccinella septempunctata]|uniref:mitoferrin-1 n=1 Tax=Coccinella septempunctata TaxID=41139 RepID=UPI001D0960FE|nr:mitoferrin-1 [Coccinella septempunctata]XP_044755858.1 mitoferrin-1 [Coccinella septempunctata]
MNPDDYEVLPTNNVVTHMTAGAIAGVMEHCVMYPLDSVKTRMQSLSRTNQHGIIDTFYRMVKKEGLFRPVRGMSAMVVGAGPSHALYFSTYEYIKNSLRQRTNSTRYHPVIHGAAGCIATLLHDGFMNPAEVIKQRLQMSNSPYKTALECLVKVYRKEGVAAFYRSYTTQLTMNVPFQCFHFITYEWMQKKINKEGKYNPSAHMISGAIAGAAAAAITTPLDVCKTLLNTQQDASATGLVHAVKTVYRLGGPTGYFRGMQARIMYQMPSTAICWSTYEFFKYLLEAKAIASPAVTVLAEDENSQSTARPVLQNEPSTPEKTTIMKPRELPSIASGTGLYGALTFNTMHTSEANFSSRSKGTVLDCSHT